MSGWASLSGYLHLKPGGGALSILKAKKRMWCVLEESQGRLLYFKSEEDARSKAPLGYVELRGAAITLDMDNHNQFVIIVDNKDVLLTAENHESMMIWLMALQARRDQFTLADKSRSSSTSTDNELDIDQNFLNVVESREREVRQQRRWRSPLSHISEYEQQQQQQQMLQMTHWSLTQQHIYQHQQQQQQRHRHRYLSRHRPSNCEGQTQRKRHWSVLKWLRSASDLAVMRERADQYLMSQGAPLTPQHRPLEGASSLNTGLDPFSDMGYIAHSPQWRRDRLSKMGQTIDSGHPSEKMHMEKDRSRSLPPLLEDPPGYLLDPSSRNISASVEMAFRAQQHRYSQQQQQQQQHQQQQQQQLLRYHHPLPMLQLPDYVSSLDEISNGDNNNNNNSVGGSRSGGGGSGCGDSGGGVGSSGGSGGGVGASLASFVGGSSSSSTDTSDDVGVEVPGQVKQHHLHHHHDHNNHHHSPHQQLLFASNNCINNSCSSSSSSSSPALYQNKQHQKVLHRAVVRSVSDRGSR
ncbi:hypothetical protein EGW08_005371, partial [Elysia chlorotica]